MQKLLICRRLLLPGHKYVGQNIFFYPFPPLKCKKYFYPRNNCHWPDVSIAFFWLWQDVSSILLALAKRQYSILLALARRQYSIKLLKCYTDVWPVTKECYTDAWPVPKVCYTDVSSVPKECYTDVWAVTIITRVEALFAFLRRKGVTKKFMIYIFVISEQ